LAAREQDDSAATGGAAVRDRKMARTISSEAALSIAIGLVVIAGIGLTGATLDSTEQIGGTNDTALPEDPEDEGQGDAGGPPQAGEEPSNITGGGQEDSQGGISRCVEPLASTPGTALVVFGFLAIVGFVFQRYNFSASLLVGWTLLPPVALTYFLLTNCAEEGGGGGSGGGPEIPGGTALDVSVNVPPWAMLGVAGLVLLGAVGLMYRTMSDEEVVTIEEDTDEDADLDEFARAAGRAADRIEEHDVDVDNAVYRAWVEMTDLINVDNPDTYAAGEFATVAIDLGMADDDVNELTTLFNEVRYGDRDAETREDRALSVLRNIESEYSDPADDGSRDDGPSADDGSRDDGPSADDADADPTGGDAE
jgi:hypothetical protein